MWRRPNKRNASIAKAPDPSAAHRAIWSMLAAMILAPIRTRMWRRRAGLVAAGRGDAETGKPQGPGSMLHGPHKLSLKFARRGAFMGRGPHKCSTSVPGAIVLAKLDGPSDKGQTKSKNGPQTAKRC